MSKPERIWIIGASDGIGKALAVALADEGAHLILSARSAEKLSQITKDLGPEHLSLPVDVSNRGSLEAAAEVISQGAPLDRIVHMAGLYDPGSVSDLDPEMAAKIVAVNLTGCFHVAQISQRLLRKGGQLALCGSVAGYIGLPQGQIYSATKAGVINLAESLRAEWVNNIDVKLISPGFVDTRLTQRNAFSMPALMTPDQAAKSIIKGLNSRRFEIHFPRRFTYVIKLIAALPYWASIPITRRLVR